MQPGQSCCSGNATGHECCSGNACDSGCSCGDNCQCQQNKTPPRPTVPPADNSSPERILMEMAAATSCGVTFHPAVTARQHLATRAGADTLSALDRCATLCRFTV
jgi:hypothetical protein